MQPLMDFVTSHDGVQVFTNCSLVGLERDGQHWIATCNCQGQDEEQEEHAISCRSVILAAGGFAGSPEAIANAAPRLVGLPTTNKATLAAGSVLNIAETAGAQLIQLDQVQV